MAPVTAYPQDIDLVWIASDADGNVAAFVTGGQGPIAMATFNHRAISYEAIEEHLMQLPVSCNAQMHVALNRHDDFIAMASRGLYVYDWQDVHRVVGKQTQRYELIASPSKTIRALDLPSELRACAEACALKSIYFSGATSIEVTSLISCLMLE